MKPTLTLIDAFPNFDYGDGIFDAIADQYTSQTLPAWLNDTQTLDTHYFIDHSGRKPVSPSVFYYLEQNEDSEQTFRVTGTTSGTVQRFLTSLHERFRVAQTPSTDGLTDDQRDTLAAQIVALFGDKWARLYSVLVTTTYDPIENYNMEETETPNLTDTSTRKFKSQTTGSSSGAGSVYGFNSSTAVPQSESEAEATSTTQGSATDNVDTTEHHGTRTLERSGNIGVTTTQQMIASEIELRNSNFIEIVMADVDKVLALRTY